jgi:hypothetical protein
MRITITLDPDVEQMLKSTMRERDVTFKDAVNSAIRKGLQTERKGAEPRRKKFRQRTYPMGVAAPGLNWDKALQIAADLEDEEILKKLAAGR